jgi:hypothetical protein
MVKVVCFFSGFGSRLSLSPPSSRLDMLRQPLNGELSGAFPSFIAAA